MLFWDKNPSSQREETEVVLPVCCLPKGSELKGKISYYVTGYAWVILFLLGAYLLLSFFSFSFFSDPKVGILSATEVVGGVIVGANKTGAEFFAGVRGGLSLFGDNIFFAGALVKNYTKQSFSILATEIYQVVSSANQKVSRAEKKVYADLKSVQISLAQQAVDTKNSVLVSDLSLSDWVIWMINPSVVPIMFMSYERNILPFRRVVNGGVATILNITNSVASGVYIAWGNFFGQFGKSGNVSDLSDATLREQLKKEILQELQNSNTVSLKDGVITSTYADTGLVLMRPTGSSTVDLNSLKKLQDSFSDRILVNFDSVGDSGVIQPIFRDRVGEKYMFIMTPVKK